MGDSTVYRHLDTSVLLVGGSTGMADICAAAFETVRIRVIRVANLAQANEQIPVIMPQMVVVLEPLKTEEREAMNDHAKAVGALVLDVDPTLDETTRDEILDHAAKAAFERGLVRDEPPTRRGEPVT